jgi:2-(1,2-epoxy-1,2-dihydrophenyl)acetyl-CoA isomerase
MAYSAIELERDGDVAVIRLNDPATLNAVTLKTVEEINSALDEITGSARAMVLIGAGRAFCSGANLSGGMDGAQAEGPRDAGIVLESHFNPLMLRLRDLPFPWVAAVKGSAAGVGCSFALAADLVVAGEGAFFLQALRGSDWCLMAGRAGCSHAPSAARGRWR